MMSQQEAARWLIQARRAPNTPERATPDSRLAFVRERMDEINCRAFTRARRNAIAALRAELGRAPSAEERETALLYRLGFSPD
jgi:hypothetical protein